MAGASVGGALAGPLAGGRLGVLGLRDFRLLWLSTVTVGSSQQMELLALGWFVLEETNSAFLVGLVGAARWWGMLFAPFGGVLADRVSRRSLLLAVEVVMLAGGMAIGALAFAGRLDTGPLVVIVLVGGLARAFEQTARQAFLGDLVTRDRLTGGVALLQAAMNGSAVLAPTIAGLTFGVAGVAGCYVFVSALLLGAVLATAMIRPATAPAAGARSSPMRSLVEGVAYVRRTPVVAALLWIAAIANLCGFPLTFAMLPSFARDVLGTGSAGLGVLMSGVGVGALAGNLLLGTRGSVHGRGRLVFVGMLAWMAAIALFSLTHWLPLAVAALVLVGACSAVSMALVAALLLGATPERLRGRVMGVRMFAIATMPPGVLAAGWLIEQTGVPLTLILFAAGGAVLTLAVAARLPQLARQS
ncbi:MAG: MFS transporter [Dehalococcoidia bacterium]